jgi:hypothetical protein
VAEDWESSGYFSQVINLYKNFGRMAQAEAEVMEPLDKSPNDEGIDVDDRQAWVTAEASSRL